MRTYNVLVQQAEDGWIAAHAREVPASTPQGRTFDEIIRNIREVSELLHARNRCRSNWSCRRRSASRDQRMGDPEIRRMP